LRVTRHRGSNSYDIHIRDFHTVEKPLSACPKMDTQDCPEVDTLDCPDLDSLEASILTEQTKRNRQRGTRAADTLRSVVAEPVKKAAAAARPLPLFDEPQTPPAPPQAAPKTPPTQIRVQDPIPGLARAMAGELGKVHPQPGLLQRAVPEIERILRAGPDLEASGERIWNNHAAWMPYWATLEAGKFIPQLWRWLRDGDWENPPVIRKPAQKESRIDRGVRMWDEARRKRGRA